MSYSVRKLKIGKTELLDQLAHEWGQVYTQTVVWFWRTVRRQEKWLKPKHIMRWINSDQLHAHTADLPPSPASEPTMRSISWLTISPRGQAAELRKRRKMYRWIDRWPDLPFHESITKAEKSVKEWI